MFHKAAKVFKMSTQRMQLMKIDPNVVEDKLANQGVSWKFITEREPVIVEVTGRESADNSKSLSGRCYVGVAQNKLFKQAFE